MSVCVLLCTHETKKQQQEHRAAADCVWVCRQGFVVLFFFFFYIRKRHSLLQQPLGSFLGNPLLVNALCASSGAIFIAFNFPHDGKLETQRGGGLGNRGASPDFFKTVHSQTNLVLYSLF